MKCWLTFILVFIYMVQGLTSHRSRCTTAKLPNPRGTCCGRDGTSSNKITGGSATEIDQYPWLALLEYKVEDKVGLLCGGVLISRRYVLTAAHCVLGRLTEVSVLSNVRLGEYDTTNDGADCVPIEGGSAGDDDCTQAPVVIPIQTVTVHPGYKPSAPGRRHDLALLRLAKLAPYTYFVRPICLPTADVTLNFPASEKLFAAGWGAIDEKSLNSNIKLHVALPYADSESCQSAWDNYMPFKLWPEQLCAGGEAGKDTCKGDSGGPLMFSTGEHYELVGISSFGANRCGMEYIPGIYVKVYKYLDWIKNIVDA